MSKDGVSAVQKEPEKRGINRLKTILNRRPRPPYESSVFNRPSRLDKANARAVFAKAKDEAETPEEETPSEITMLAEQYETLAQQEEAHIKTIDEIISTMGESSIQELFKLMQHFSEEADYLTPNARKRAVKDLQDRISYLIDLEDDPVRVVMNLFETWAPTYDTHMAATGHDAAVEALLKQAVELRRLQFGGGKYPLIGNQILELSGGTGTVIKLLCDALQYDDEKFRVTLNDLSPSMKRFAMEKLAPYSSLCKLEMSSEDLRDARFKLGDHNTAILSQTLHLITDPELMREQNSPDGVAESSDHKQIKRKVIRTALNALAWGGHFVLIDEWPAKLSDSPRKPMEFIINKMFHGTFKPIADKSIFRDDIMDPIREARFVAELKARIDAKHSMYMIIYRKDWDKAHNEEKYVPHNEQEARMGGVSWGEVQKARGSAKRMIIEAFKAIDKHFVKTYRPVNGERENWTDFLQFEPHWESETSVINPSAAQLEHEDRYSTIIICEKLHNMEDKTRRDMVRRALKSLKIGGSLLFIDEWQEPPGSNNPLRKRDIRSKIMNTFEGKVIFEGSLRQPIMHGYGSGYYGYLFRKIKCTD